MQKGNKARKEIGPENQLKRHEKVYVLYNFLWMSEGLDVVNCCIENSGQENKKKSHSGASLEQSALLHCQHRLGGGYLVNYYPRTALDIFRWLGLPQILKIERQNKHGVIFFKPGCRHPDCLVVSEEGLMRFYPGVDSLDPNKKIYHILLAEVKGCNHI